MSQNDEQTQRFQRDLPASHDHHMQAQQTGKVPFGRFNFYGYAVNQALRSALSAILSKMSARFPLDISDTSTPYVA